jgi:hypothetical protein
MAATVPGGRVGRRNACSIDDLAVRTRVCTSEQSGCWQPGPTHFSMLKRLSETDFKHQISKIDNAAFPASKNYGKIKPIDEMIEQKQLCPLGELPIWNRFKKIPQVSEIWICFEF